MVSAVSELEQLTQAAHLATDGTAAGARAAIDTLSWLASAIHDDRTAGRFIAWGRSSVIDENTGAGIIPRALFEELHVQADIAADWPIGNAGVLHCYGYLLSLEPTPYGLKRERWTEGVLAHACHLPPDAFHPWREGPILLARATAVASALLSSPAAGATQVIDARETRLALGAVRGSTALAYAVAPSAGATPLLVTMFPVADAIVPLTEFRTDPRLRWNAA